MFALLNLQPKTGDHKDAPLQIKNGNEKTMSKYDDLVAKLKEIFHIDRPELDFGVYRILNARAGEINDYLDNRLKARVQEALNNSGNANLEQARKELDEAEKNAQSLGMKPDDVPKVRELRQRIVELSAGSIEHENAVFSHLLTFFSRYYDSGDFISQRRYKGDTYAIPYAGEEVVLHWANIDQYYTKSGENFANYSFRLPDGRTVHFRLVAADTAKDNRKDNDKERRFVLIERQTRLVADEEGDEYEEELLPVEEVNDDLLLRFEYRPMPKGSKQEDLVGKAVQTVLGNDTVKSRWLDLAKREPTEKNPQRTLLEKHLTTYTQKNSADYFIHKNLGGFLRRELDFYIKNEVMNLDDVQNAERFAEIEKNLRMIQCLRAIALDLITFLAQLEDFQKKLWEKKKFVVAAHYCITLDRVTKDAPELLDAIVANERQWEQWDKLGMLEKSATRNGDYLKAHPFLMVDSSLFDGAFKDKLLATIDNLDESLDGLLVHGDNFQALNLLQERYREQVKCMYIDPPYNTSENAFLYKNQYKHSSWISLISNGAGLTPRLMASNGIIIGAIDDTEYSNFKYLLSDIFGAENYVGTIASEVNPAGQNIRPNVPARSHDYTHIFAKDIEAVDMVLRVLTKEEREQYKEKDDIGSYYWDNLRRRGGNSRPTDRPKQWFPLFVEGKRVRVPDMSWDEAQQKWIVLNLPSSGELEVWPIDPKGEKRIWRVNPDGARRGIDEGEISVIEKAGRKEVSKKSREPEGKKPKTLWAEPKYSATSHGSKLLLDILGQGLQFSYPKSIHLTTDSIRYWVELSSLVCDFFAGSGTTGHAVINLNREDSGQRKYILVEQGKYFDTVLKPRIQKVIYSADWKDGRAAAPETGISHAFKVLKIESYEDTLNNLELRRSAQQQSLLEGLGQEAKDDYLLRYMLNIESRGSILSVDSFRKPFDCTLKVAVDSAGAWEERTIDLVETFNYLIGLRVRQIDSLRERGIVMVQGTLPTGEKTLVLWRDCAQVDYETLNRFCDSHDINPRDSEFEVVYINGDHNIPSVLMTTEEEGGITKVLKLRQIEPEFLGRMFDGEV